MQSWGLLRAIALAMTVEFMNREKYSWIYDVFFLLVLVLAGYLRLTGVDWGEDSISTLMNCF